MITWNQWMGNPEMCCRSVLIQTAVKNAIAMIKANSKMQCKDDKGWQNKYFHQQEEKKRFTCWRQRACQTPKFGHKNIVKNSQFTLKTLDYPAVFVLRQHLFFNVILYLGPETRSTNQNHLGLWTIHCKGNKITK